MAPHNPPYHFLISKQLKRADLREEDIAPQKRDAWHDFLSRVSRTYFDQEQERYLLERSMEISSREMLDLNERLERAQKIAHLGYWQYDYTQHQFMWSKEIFHMTGFDPQNGIPTAKELVSCVHEDDRGKMELLIRDIQAQSKECELEFRYKNKEWDHYQWFYIKGNPYHSKNVVDQTVNASYLSGIIIDITEQKVNEENIKNMHQQLLAISRQAGMSEVATAVLHNMGNVLNSASVSLSMIIEALEQSREHKLVKIAEIIKEHTDKQDKYLISDEKGKLIPDYLLALAKDLLETHNHYTHEINNISTHLHHIKDIVALQKDISGVSGLKEKIVLRDIVDLAIHMSSVTTENVLAITKNYEFEDTITTEKAKLLQILVNLIRNAQESLMLSHTAAKELIISIKNAEIPSHVEISVQDNGAGILKQHLTRIFNLGFTTKPTGHGFGLHSSAIAARELGGSLSAASDGEGLGATFKIVLPIVNTTSKEEKNDAISA